MLLRTPRRSHKHASRADGLYGALYPANHLRLVDFIGDPADGTAVWLVFDRDLAAPLPPQVDLWCGDRRAFTPEVVAAAGNVARVRFNCPLSASWSWSFNPASGSFRGADGCSAALAASGVLREASGPAPADKIWLGGITRIDTSTIEFNFNTAATSTGDASGFWCIDEFGATQYGYSVSQPASEIIRVGFAGTIATPTRLGLVAGFSGIVEAGNLLCPLEWRAV